VQQSALAVEHRKLLQVQARQRQRRLDLGAPRPFALRQGGGRQLVVAAPDQRQARLGPAAQFGLGQRLVGRSQPLAQWSAARHLGAAGRQMQDAAAAAGGRALHGQMQGLVQVTGQLLAPCRQPEREIGAIHAAGQAARRLLGVQAQGLADQRQRLVGGAAPEQAVDTRQVAQAHQQQAGALRALVARQRRGQFGLEMLAQVQTGQRVAVRLLAQQAELLGVRGKQMLDAHHHAVERARQRLQLAHTAGLDLQKLPVGQRMGLAGQVVERAADALQQRPGREQRGQRQHGRPGGHAQQAGPQRVVGVGELGRQFNLAQLLPAAGELGQTGLGLDRHPARQPGRMPAALLRGLALESHAAVGARPAQHLVMPGVELRAHQQLDEGRVTALLAGRQRQRLRVVGVLDRGLLRQQLAHRTAADQQRTSERQRQHQHQQPGNPSHQAHSEPLRTRPGQGVAPDRQSCQRIARCLHRATPGATTLPKALGVEAEHRRQIAALAGPAQRRVQVVEDQRLGVRLRIPGQHHVRLHPTLVLRPHIDQAQAGLGQTQAQQREVLAHRQVLAVPGALGQHLQRTGPVVHLAPDLAVVAPGHLGIEEVVDGRQLPLDRRLALLRHQLQQRPRLQLRRGGQSGGLLLDA
jgi:hypothetical protein